MSTSEDGCGLAAASERSPDEPDSQIVAAAPRRPFRVRPISGGLGPDLASWDPRAIKNFLNELDDEHYFEVLRRSPSREE